VERTLRVAVFHGLWGCPITSVYPKEGPCGSSTEHVLKPKKPLDIPAAFFVSSDVFISINLCADEGHFFY
jgi:hypothetical protein